MFGEPSQGERAAHYGEGVVDGKVAEATNRAAEFFTKEAWMAKIYVEKKETTALGKAELAKRYAKHDSEVAAFQLRGFRIQVLNSR